MPSVLPISGPAVLLRAALDRAEQVTTQGMVADGDFATIVDNLIQAKLSVQTTAFVAHTLEELTTDLLLVHRK